MYNQENTLTIDMLNALLKHIPLEDEATNLQVVLPEEEYDGDFFLFDETKTILINGSICLTMKVRCRVCDSIADDYYLARDDDGFGGWHMVVDIEGEQVADTREAEYHCETHRDHDGDGIRIEAHMYVAEIGEDGEVRTEVTDHPLVREALEHFTGHSIDTPNTSE